MEIVPKDSHGVRVRYFEERKADIEKKIDVCNQRLAYALGLYEASGHEGAKLKIDEISKQIHAYEVEIGFHEDVIQLLKMRDEKSAHIYHNPLFGPYSADLTERISGEIHCSGRGRVIGWSPTGLLVKGPYKDSPNDVYLITVERYPYFGDDVSTVSGDGL